MSNFLKIHLGIWISTIWSWIWHCGQDVIVIKSVNNKFYVRILHRIYDPFTENVPPVIKIDGNYYFVYQDNTIRDARSYLAFHQIGLFPAKIYSTIPTYGTWIHADETKRVVDALSKI